MEARILDGDKLRVTQDPKEIHAALEAKRPIWIELEKKDHACDVLLSQQLNLHPLTIEDIGARRGAPGRGGGGGGRGGGGRGGGAAGAGAAGGRGERGGGSGPTGGSAHD